MELLIGAIAVIAGGILAASGLIISKSPNAKDLINKMTPFQGFLGVGLLAFGVIELIRMLDLLPNAHRLSPVFAIGLYGYLASLILIGFFLGMPQIAKWIPGENPAEQKAMDMQKKLAPYQAILGVVGIVSGVLMLYYYFKMH
jgi:hypothetical protein